MIFARALPRALSLASALSFAVAAQAQEVPMVVRVADLNIASPAGAAAALHRIDAAAERFCGAPDLRDLTTSRYAAGCRRAMTERAVAQTGSPMVTALYQKYAAPEAVALR